MSARTQSWNRKDAGREGMAHIPAAAYRVLLPVMNTLSCRRRVLLFLSYPVATVLAGMKESV